MSSVAHVTGATMEFSNLRPNQGGEGMPFDSVQIFPENEKWVVVVIENDDEMRRAFAIEKHAHSYADGQRIRLGLPPTGQHISNASLNDEGGALSQ